MKPLRLRKATLADAAYLATRLREADLKEVNEGGAKSPLDSLMQGVSLSEEAYSAVDDKNLPVVIFGIIRAKDIGLPWLLASDAIEKHAVQFLRYSRPLLEDLAKKYYGFYTVAHKDNELHRKWLKWCGFAFIKEHNNFHTFQRINHV